MVAGKIPWDLKAKNLEELYYEVEKQSKVGIKFPADVKISE